MQFYDLLIILIITAGATKAAALFLAEGAALSRPQKIQIAFRALAIQAGVLGFFAWRGENILELFHVSVPALEVAGGLVLLIFALQLVLGEDHAASDGPPPGLGMAVYPLAVPLLASPQAIVAVTIASTTLGYGNRGPLWLALAIVLALNAVVMFGIAFMGPKKDTSKDSFSVAPVVLRVVALLLCALAVEIMALGLRGYGVLPPMPTPEPVVLGKSASH